jgi:T5SS/PEP-CTERM-associated repeat protein
MPLHFTHRVFRRIITPLAVTLVAALFATPAPAENFEWVGPSLANFFTPGNWTPAGGPPDDSSDEAIFNVAGTGTYQLFVTSDVTNARLRVHSGEVTLVLQQLGEPREYILASEFSMLVGEVLPANLTLHTGALTAVGNLVIGRTGDARVELLNGATLSTGILMDVGIDAPGEVIVTQGTINSQAAIIGDSSSGRIDVIGPNSRWYNTGVVTIGSFDVGQLFITGGGNVTSSSVILGQNNTGSGMATISGPGSTWTNNGSLYVGPAGLGELTIEAGGSVAAAAAIGGFPGSLGSVTVKGTGSRLDISGRRRSSGGNGGLG